MEDYGLGTVEFVLDVRATDATGLIDLIFNKEFWSEFNSLDSLDIDAGAAIFQKNGRALTITSLNLSRILE